MRRICLGMLLAALFACQTGCCHLGCLDFGHGPAGPLWTRTWCGPQCGEVFWNEWFSIPPLCCDPCNDCGDFTCSDNPYVLNGPTESKYGPIYDDGVRAPGYVKKSYSEPYTAPKNTPTPARVPTPARAPVQDELTAPPVEELPSLEPTTALDNKKFDQAVSFDEAVDSSSPVRKVRKLRRPTN